MIVAIFVFAPIGLPAWYWLVATRILGVPLIAGLSFEVIKWAGRNRAQALGPDDHVAGHAAAEADHARARPRRSSPSRSPRSRPCSPSRTRAPRPPRTRSAWRSWPEVGSCPNERPRPGEAGVAHLVGGGNVEGITSCPGRARVRARRGDHAAGRRVRPGGRAGLGLQGGRAQLPALSRRHREHRRHARDRSQHRARPGAPARARATGTSRVFDARPAACVAGSAGARAPTSSPRASSARARRCSSRRAASAAPRAARDLSVTLRRRSGPRGPRGRRQGAGRRRSRRPTAPAKKRLQGLGLDLTEHGDADSSRSCCTARADERRRSRDAGFAYDVRDRRPRAAQAEANRRADAALRGRDRSRPRLPSGRNELPPAGRLRARAQAARAASTRAWCRPITLEPRDDRGPRRQRHRDHAERRRRRRRQADLPQHGRPPRARVAVVGARDGVGLRPARATTAATAAPRAWSNATRTIVDPDRQPRRLQHLARGARRRGRLRPVRLRDEAQELQDLREHAGAVPRRAPATPTRPAACAAPTPTATTAGFWGGPGASTNWSSDTYRGDAPFSEPEVAEHPRAAGHAADHEPDHQPHLLEPRAAPAGRRRRRASRSTSRGYKALGERMAGHNGYANIPSFGLYDTTGAHRGLDVLDRRQRSASRSRSARTSSIPPFEHGRRRRVPRPRARRGRGQGRQPRGLLRDARRPRPTRPCTRASPASRPAGSTLTISKTFQTSTSPVLAAPTSAPTSAIPSMFEDTLVLRRSSRRAGGSTVARQPVDPAGRRGPLGRDAVGPPAGGRSRSPTRTGIPAENTGDPEPARTRRSTFTVDGPPEVDNGKMTVHIEWARPGHRLGPVHPQRRAGNIVSQSAASAAPTEDARAVRPAARARTPAIVVNYDQATGDRRLVRRRVRLRVARARRPRREGGLDAHLRAPDGTQSRPLQVFVDRGQRREVGNACKKAKKDKKD